MRRARDAFLRAGAALTQAHKPEEMAFAMWEAASGLWELAQHDVDGRAKALVDKALKPFLEAGKQRAEEQQVLEQVEERIVKGAVRPSRWLIISKTTPSGKAMFVCRSCGRVTPAPTDICGEVGGFVRVRLHNGAERRCDKWEEPPEGAQYG